MRGVVFVFFPPEKVVVLHPSVLASLFLERPFSFFNLFPKSEIRSWGSMCASSTWPSLFAEVKVLAAIYIWLFWYILLGFKVSNNEYKLEKLLLFIMGINSNLRIGDLLKLKVSDIWEGRNCKEYIVLWRENSKKWKGPQQTHFAPIRSPHIKHGRGLLRATGTTGTT